MALLYGLYMNIGCSVMAWQIALQLVRQGATMEPAVASIQGVEPKENKVEFHESSQNIDGKSNPELVETSGPEQLSETSTEVDKEQPQVPDHWDSSVKQSAEVL